MGAFDKMNVQNPVALVAAILSCIILGSLGGIVTRTGPDTWYALLEKPAFSPPGWLFGPVWTLLFILMGISLWMVWKEGIEKRDVRIALGVFAVQFIFNIAWSFLFFGMQSPFLGLVDILILWILILATIVCFFQVQKTAAFLLIPYILWVSFASFLNYTIFILNP
jgi:tryptophan-rich sensory protein